MFNEKDEEYFKNIKNLLDSAERYQNSSDSLYREGAKKNVALTDSEINLTLNDDSKKNRYLSYAPLEKSEKIFLDEHNIFSIVPQLWFQLAAFQEKFVVSGPPYLCQIVRLASYLLKEPPFPSLKLKEEDLFNKFADNGESVYIVKQVSPFTSNYYPTVQPEDLCTSLRLHALILIYYEFVEQFIKAKELANEISNAEESKENFDRINKGFDEKSENNLLIENVQEIKNEFLDRAERRKKAQQEKGQKKVTDLIKLFIGSNFLLDPYARVTFQTQMAALDLIVIFPVSEQEKIFLEKVNFVFELLNLLQKWNICTNLFSPETLEFLPKASSESSLTPISSFALSEVGYIKSLLLFDLFSTKQRNGEIPVFTLQNISQTIRATLINLQSNAKTFEVNPELNVESISIQGSHSEELKEEEPVNYSNSDVFFDENVSLENLKNMDWSSVKHKPAVIRFLVSVAMKTSSDQIKDYFPNNSGYGYSLGLALSSYLTKKEEELCTLINNRIENNDLTSDEALGYQIALQMFVFKHISCLQKYLLILGEDKEKVFDEKFASLGFQRLSQNGEQTLKGCDYGLYENRKKLSQAVRSLKGHSSKNPEMYISVIRLLQSYVKTLIISDLFYPQLSHENRANINTIWSNSTRAQAHHKLDSLSYDSGKIADEFKSLHSLLMEYFIPLQEQISVSTIEEKMKNGFILENVYQLLDAAIDPNAQSAAYPSSNKIFLFLAPLKLQNKVWAEDLHVIFAPLLDIREKLEANGHLSVLMENRESKNIMKIN